MGLLENDWKCVDAWQILKLREPWSQGLLKYCKETLVPKKFAFQCADHIPFLNEGTFPLKGSHKNSNYNFNFFFSGRQELQVLPLGM